MHKFIEMSSIFSANFRKIKDITSFGF